MAGPWEKYKVAEAPEPDSETQPEGPWSRFADQKTKKESKVNSAVRKFNQGATFGWSDEIMGLGEAAGRAIGVEGFATRPISEMSLSDDGPTLDPKKLKDAYLEARDQERRILKKDKKDHPKLSATAEVVGGLVSPVNRLAKGMTMAKGGMTLGGVAGLGMSDAETIGGMARDTAIGSGSGLLIGKGLDVGISKAAPVVKAVADKAGSKLKGFAEKAAVNSTGATGKQASEFSDDAGRELLDRGIVKFGDSQEQIAGKAASALKQAEAQIDSSLKKLEAAGVKVDGNDIYNSIRTQIDKIKSDPSKADIAGHLERELENLIEAAASNGSSKWGVLAAEQVKRGFNRKSGNWVDPEKGQAGKTMYQAWRGGVEDAAKAADPATAKLFEEGKKTYGLLAPIEEAAARRAATTAQSPPGGFLDVSAAAAGALASGGAGAIAVPVGRRLVAPRISSSVAVTADKVSKMLLATPNGANLAKSNPELFQATVMNLARKYSQAPNEMLSNVASGSDAPAPMAPDGPSSPTQDPNMNSEKEAPKAPDRAPANEKKEIPKKGPEKWAADGFDKVARLAPGLDRQRLLKDPQKRELLMRASSLEPNSKAMSRLVAELRRAK